MSGWVDNFSMGKVLFDFEANGQFQINLKAGETVEVHKSSSGWYKGKVIRPGAGELQTKGIFPVSFI